MRPPYHPPTETPGVRYDGSVSAHDVHDDPRPPDPDTLPDDRKVCPDCNGGPDVTCYACNDGVVKDTD